MIFGMCLHETVGRISCKCHWNRRDRYCVRGFHTCNWGNMKNQAWDEANSWHHLRQISFQSWRTKHQYPMKSPRAANTLQTRQRQLCIKRRIDAWAMSFHIRWTYKCKSTTLRMTVLGLFSYRLMKYCAFSIRYKSGLLLSQSDISTASQRSRSLLFALCGVAPSCMEMVGSAAGGWRGVAELECRWPRQNSTERSCCPDLDQWEFANKGNVPQHHDRSVSVGVSSSDTNRMETFKGRSLTPPLFALYLA